MTLRLLEEKLVSSLGRGFESQSISRKSWDDFLNRKILKKQR